jgi:hypothetical protein
MTFRAIHCWVLLLFLFIAVTQTCQHSNSTTSGSCLLAIVKYGRPQPLSALSFCHDSTYMAVWGDTSPTLTVRRLFNALVVSSCSVFQLHVTNAVLALARSVLAVERLRSFYGIPSVPSVGTEPAARGKTAMWEFPTAACLK